MFWKMRFYQLHIKLPSSFWKQILWCTFQSQCPRCTIWACFVGILVLQNAGRHIPMGRASWWRCSSCQMETCYTPGCQLNIDNSEVIFVREMPAVSSVSTKGFGVIAGMALVWLPLLLPLWTRHSFSATNFERAPGFKKSHVAQKYCWLPSFLHADLQSCVFQIMRKALFNASALQLTPRS